ncbi:MAG: hypothetical protein J0L66_16495 [Cytophagales bacterium]|nr:hypothetical protein [Cytophagales bacterium]
MTNTLTRRNWLRTSALAAGSLVTGLSVLDKPAFGMTPFKGTYGLREDFFPPAADEIKARLSANENPWGPSKNAVAAIAESATKGNRYVYNSSREMEELLAKKEGVSPDHI